MVVRGYEAKSVGRGVHDTYLKPPVYNFEFHTSLFSEALEDGRFAEHFAGVRERAMKDEGNAYGYHLAAGDLYVYVAAHAYKHHAGSGTGLRAVADNYAMRRALGSELRFAEIDRELGELGILGFDEALRSLGDRLLGKPADEWPELGEDEEELLARLAGAGAYGNVRVAAENGLLRIQGEGRLTRATKLRYLVRRVFPGVGHMRQWSPVADRWPILVPVMYVLRIGKVLLRGGRRLRAEVDAVRRA